MSSQNPQNAYVPFGDKPMISLSFRKMMKYHKDRIPAHVIDTYDQLERSYLMMNSFTNFLLLGYLGHHLFLRRKIWFKLTNSPLLFLRRIVWIIMIQCGMGLVQHKRQRQFLNDNKQIFDPIIQEMKQHQAQRLKTFLSGQQQLGNHSFRISDEDAYVSSESAKKVFYHK